MDWQTLAATMPRDTDYPPRAAKLEHLTRVLEGTLYDAIPNAFADEKTPGGEYIPLRQRRPSVRTNIVRVVVDDSVSLLFDEGHFPEFVADDKAAAEALGTIAKALRLNARMIEVATRGSVGSAALHLRVVDGRPRVDVLQSCYLTPTFDPADGETLTLCTESFKVPRAGWLAMGVTPPGDDTEYWWRRDWTADAEIVFKPQSVIDRREGKAPEEMASVTPVAGQAQPVGTVRHGLGFVPIVWVRNLPGGDDVDGAPTLIAPAISTMIEADYQLSQAGRGLKYAADPTLLIKEPNGDGSPPRVGGAASALIVSEKGDAKLLEINGTAAAAVIEYVSKLREIALEAMHGNRSNADKLSAAQSGRALELMHQPLIWLADRLRISYGEMALLALLRMICAASKVYPLTVAGVEYRALNPAGLALKWPPWFAPTAEDRLAQGQALAALTGAGLMSRETAVGDLAPVYDVEDQPAELARLDAETAAREAAAKKEAANV